MKQSGKKSKSGPEIPFSTDDFPNSDQVLVAFRILGSRKHEHWLNKAAVYATADPFTKVPQNFCHVEIMFQPYKGAWVRSSVVKKTWVGNDEKNKPIFEWGKVHMKYVDQNSWDSKYKFLSVSVSRKKQKKCYDFLVSQVDGPFNYWGYVLNILLPHGGIGAGKFHPGMNQDRSQWYCSQLVGAGLQAMSDDDALDHGPYADEDETHLRRAAAACASLLFGSLVGLFFAYYIALFEALSRRNAILAGFACGLGGFWFMASRRSWGSLTAARSTTAPSAARGATETTGRRA